MESGDILITMLVHFQDCKEFQGELFGICNLFRDLSDKLFTSEIIELHKKQGQENEHPPSKEPESMELGNTSVSEDHDNQPSQGPELMDLGNTFVPIMKSSLSQSEIGTVRDTRKNSSNPALEDLG